MNKQAMIVEHEIFIAANPREVWDTIISQEGMKAWLGPSTYEAHIGGKIDFNATVEGGKYYIFGEIITMDAPRVLAFTWTEQPVGGTAWDTSTTVSIILTPQNDGTIVKLQHSGFEKLGSDIAENEYKGYVQGWSSRHSLDDLKTFVESKIK